LAAKAQVTALLSCHPDSENSIRYVLVVAWALVCFNRLEGQAWEDH